MTDALELTIADETLVLLGGRALHWPSRRRLVIADLHLGKADTFRAAGIALPRGGTAGDLSRVTTLLEQTGAQSLWVLGDMLHGALVDTAWRPEWESFRAAHAALAIVVVEGNHDRALIDARLDIDVRTTAQRDGPFVWSHALERSPLGFCVSGHRHPVVRVPGIAGRHPCFDLTDGGLVLPAFSAFTGGVLLEKTGGWVACVHGLLVPALG